MPVEGRDLSSRQTQYVVKDLEIGQPIKPAPTGSITDANTIGTVRVVCSKEATAAAPDAVTKLVFLRVFPHGA